MVNKGMADAVPRADGPLSGYRVLELGSIAAGPFCARLFADFGADVIKVEAAEGDGIRSMGDFFEGKSLYAAAIMRNKRLISVDIRDRQCQEIVRNIVRHCDFVVENMRPGVLERHGLGYEDLSKINPALIMVRISGFGQTGPYSKRPGYGVVCEAMGGLRYITGDPERPPGRVAVPLTDYLTGLYGAFGAMMALDHRHRTGKGQCVDAALYEAAFSFMEPHVPAYEKLGAVAERAGSRLPGHSPSNLFVSRDGVYIHIAAGGDGVFRRLAAAIGQQELADDPRFATAAARNARVDEIDLVVAEWARQHDIKQIESVLLEAAVPASRLYTIADIFRDAHFRARDMLVQVPDDDLGSVTVAGPVPKLSDTPGKLRWAGRHLGQDTREVLRQLAGLPDLEIARLEAMGAIRCTREENQENIEKV